MSDSVRPHRQQPTRLPHPWDSPGKNTGVGCHFLLQCWKVKVKSLSCVRPTATPWTAAFQAPLSMGFSRQECWSGAPLPAPLQQASLGLSTWQPGRVPEAWKDAAGCLEAWGQNVCPITSATFCWSKQVTKAAQIQWEWENRLHLLLGRGDF